MGWGGRLRGRVDRIGGRVCGRILAYEVEFMRMIVVECKGLRVRFLACIVTRVGSRGDECAVEFMSMLVAEPKSRYLRFLASIMTLNK